MTIIKYLLFTSLVLFNSCHSYPSKNGQDDKTDGIRLKEFLFIGMISGLNVISDIISNSHNGESKTSFLNADFKRGCRYIWNKQILYPCPTSPLNNENAVAGWYRI